MDTEAVTRIRNGNFSLGTWLSSGTPVVTELAAEAGFDWLLLDLEHGCGTEASLLDNLRAMRGARSAAIVRVGAPSDDLILRVLDWGADGIMVPHVSTPEEAERCVQAVHYPPRGHRGFSSSARAYGYGTRPPTAGDLGTAPFLMIQIETIEGARNATEIAQVDGVDALFVGPSDLRFQIERCRPADIVYDDCLELVAAAARAAQKPWGILLRSSDQVSAHRARGATLVALHSDLSILREGFNQITEPFRASAEAILEDQAGQSLSS